MESLIERGGLVGLVTQPDRPAGRHHELQAPRVKELAKEAGIPVLQPERVRRRKALGEIEALAPDLVVVMAYGQILPKALLEMPPLGCINVHASLLPRHRGASCIQAAIDAGDRESGVTIMHMAEGLDTGDIILRQALDLSPDETGGALHDRLAEQSPGVLAEVLTSFESGTVARKPQEESLATYAPKLVRADGLLDWTRSAEELERRVRAYDPWPGTFSWIKAPNGRSKRLKIFPPTRVVAESGSPGEVLAAGPDGIVVAAGRGALCLELIQLEGSRRGRAEEFLAGHRLEPGDRLFSLESGPD